MKITEMTLPGVLEIHPTFHRDDRGRFAETYRQDLLEDVVGHSLSWAQGNTSVSVVRTIRGMHYSVAPGGQAKYVTCTSGRVWDVVADVRVGSPSFAQYSATVLTGEEGNAVYIPAGFAHGFVALTEGSQVSYLVSTPYNPVYEFGITPFDPQLDINWCGVLDPVLSDKDLRAPVLDRAQKAGVLPVYTPPDMIATPTQEKA